jgi:ParB-like chromosome segregation protein Spo0J
MSQVRKLSDLKPDQRNARRHSQRNVELIAEALREVGAARSVVVDENGNVLAGNGTIAAAALAGIAKVRVVPASGDEIVAVQRKGLTKKQKTRLALYDNRTAELAEWDLDVLGELEDDDLAGILSLDDLADSPANPDPTEGDDEKGEGNGFNYEQQYGVIVMCVSESQQQETYDRLTADGFTCRVVVT